MKGCVYMLKENTIRRIVEAYGRHIVIGRYSYRYNAINGTIQRARTEDKDEEWIDHDGRQRGAWQTVCKIYSA